MRHPLNRLRPVSDVISQAAHAMSRPGKCSPMPAARHKFVTVPTRQFHQRSHDRSWGHPRHCSSCSHTANMSQSCNQLSRTSKHCWCVSFVKQQGVSPSSFPRPQHLGNDNKHVYHSIKELHLWNLHCLLNCLDVRYLPLHHHWHIDDSVDDTFRDTLLGNDLDHYHYFSHNLWCGDVVNLLLGALPNALLNRTTSMISSTTFGTHSIVTCVLPSGRNRRRSAFLRTSVNSCPDVSTSSVSEA